MKTDSTYLYMAGRDGQLLESVSPFCHEAVERDKNAFCALMDHLKAVDENRTVIMIQVENETGVWNQPRDFSPKASELFNESIPEEMARLYHTKGTWPQAFGKDACDYFMAWGFSKAVGEIAAAGRAIYDLPMFMNSVAVGLPLKAGDVPSGGPLPRVHRIWRAFAPAIDLYGPDIYSPFYRAVSSEFAAANALMVPELSQDKNAASKALFTVAVYNTICFSPFGIDGFMAPLSENDLLAQTNSDQVAFDPQWGDALAYAYKILHLLWPQICQAQEDGRIYPFLEEGNPFDEFILDDYIIKVSYGPKGGVRKSDRPAGGGFILRLNPDSFLICGVCALVEFLPAYASQGQVFILDKREIKVHDKTLVPGRILNGDERNYTAIGSWPTLQKLTFYHR